MVPALQNVQPYNPNEYIQTAMTGNRVSRRSIILGSQNIILGGKCIIHHNAIVRGDLRRTAPSAPSGAASAAAGSTGTPGAAQAQPPAQQGSAVVIAIGRYCLLGEGCIIRPAYKTYKGAFSYYPLKMGDHVHVGAGTVLEAAVVGSHVEIGRNCIIGRFAIIKDCARIADGTVIAPNTVVPSLSVFAGSPGKHVADLPETFLEQCEARTKGYYQAFRPAS